MPASPPTPLQSLPPRDFPKLPIQLLEDFRPAPSAGLYIVAARLAAIRRATPQFKAFEWNNPGARRFNLETLMYVRADLVRAGLLKTPVVAAHPSCGVDGQKALEAAGRLKATVVDDPGAAAGAERVWWERGAGAKQTTARPWEHVYESGRRACRLCNTCVLHSAACQTQPPCPLPAADPSVTHVLYPNGALIIEESDPGSQMRTLQTR